MKLVNTYYNIELNIVENQVAVLSVENPVAYARIVGDIWHQINGEEGSYILSDADKVINIAKEVECIFNPFSLECNNKKVLSRLYQELKLNADNILQEESIQLNCSIVNYLERLVMTVPYNLRYNVDMDISALIKMYDVAVDNKAEGLLEKVVEYVKVVSQICGIKTYIFVDIKHYLTSEELKELYTTLLYEKVNLIIIEPVHTECLEMEKCWIIDKDLCIIEV